MIISKTNMITVTNYHTVRELNKIVDVWQQYLDIVSYQ